MENEIQENETPLSNEQEAEAPETSEPEKAEVKEPEQSKEFQSALAQKEFQREKREKAEARVKELEEKLQKVGQGTSVPVNPLEVVKLGKALSDYNEDETEFIIRNATDKSPDGIIKASQDDWVKTAIQAKREKVEKSKKIPEPSNVSSGEGFSEEIDIRGAAKLPDSEYKKLREKLISKGEQEGTRI